MAREKLKVAVYTMAKNEAAHVKRFAECTRDADLVVITDTGSTDGTPDLLRQEGITVHNAAITPWRFDTATNVALAMVPADVDVCVKLDLDEVLVPGWRQELERLWVGNVNRLSYWYTWSWQSPGVAGVRMVTENVHGRSGFIWRHPGHAALCSTVPNYRARSDVFEIHHFMVTKSRPNYIGLLELGVQECRCPRTLYYLGREYFFHSHHDKALATLQEYLSHPEANWKAQRAEAMCFIAMTLQKTKQLDQALSWLMRAEAEWPRTRDIWYEILRHMSMIADWGGGYWAATRCLAITKRDDQLCLPGAAAWHDRPYEFAAICAWKSGHHEQAKQYLQECLRLNPANPAIPKFAEEFGLHRGAA